MTKLSDTQLITLSSACKNDDGLRIQPAGMKPATAAKIALALTNKGLMREVKAKPGAPVWRLDDEGRPLSLKILKAGRDAIGVDDQTDDAEASQPPSVANSGRAIRSGTKRPQILDVMRRPQGASLNEMIEATGWLLHTTRAALTGLRRDGEVIERSRSDGGKSSIYRIADDAAVAAG